MQEPVNFTQRLKLSEYVSELSYEGHYVMSKVISNVEIRISGFLDLVFLMKK